MAAYESCKYCQYRPINPKAVCFVTCEVVKPDKWCSEWKGFLEEGMTIQGDSPNRLDKQKRLEQLRIRKALSLNSKDLVYYYPNGNEAYPVEQVTIDEMYSETDAWFSLKVGLKNGDERTVHSDYFADMQRGKRWSEKLWPDA